MVMVRIKYVIRLTNSFDPSLSRRVRVAASFATNQERNILMNPKFRYCVHRSPPMVPNHEPVQSSRYPYPYQYFPLSW
jgi:hypothetical protein